MDKQLQQKKSQYEADSVFLSELSRESGAALLKKITTETAGPHPEPLLEPQRPTAEDVPGPRADKSNRKKWMAVAAVCLLVLGAGAIWWLLMNKEASRPKVANNTEQYQRISPIVPGSSGAILTLSNGRKIALGSHHKGLLHIGSLTIQPGKDAAKLTNLEVAKTGAEVLYNTLTTPRGKQYQIELPDGTKVWLNASSSLRFPTIFNKQNRTVELSGEAYFEVVHNASHPFQVKVKNQLIEDIGTKFNVKAYNDEPSVRTSLIEGIVDVTSGAEKLRLKPGQAAKASSGELTLYHADLSQVLAWKSGFFAFQKAGVEDIMRQLSRWYDVDIAYSRSFHKTEGKGQLFTGSIDRNLDLQDVLDGLQFSQVHFKIDKNKRTIIIEN
jgi:ferric-dicitrate binding protein FerR (iron transport regulator)